MINNSYIPRLAAVALSGLAAAEATIAQSNNGSLDWGLSYRARFESKQDYSFTNSSQDYVVSRTRINLNWNSNTGNSVFAELQDARVAGEDGNGVPPVGDKAKGTVFADELDLHQAYWDRTFAAGRLRIGRQKLTLGDGRLSAALEWLNTARVHDGIRLSLDDNFRLI